MAHLALLHCTAHLCQLVLKGTGRLVVVVVKGPAQAAVTTGGEILGGLEMQQWPQMQHGPSQPAGPQGGWPDGDSV